MKQMVDKVEKGFQLCLSKFVQALKTETQRRQNPDLSQKNGGKKILNLLIIITKAV